MWSAGKRLGKLAIALGIVTGTAACRRSVETAGSAEPSAASSTVSAASHATLKLGTVLTAGDPGVVDVTIELNAGREAQPISSLIYGVNFDVRDVANQRWGVIRSGGNRLTAYNWENNASNAGSDYLFQNDELMGKSNAPAKPLLDQIDAALTIGAPIIITLSNASYVAADKNGGGDVRGSGPNYLSTRFKRNYAKKPTPFTALPDTSDDAVYQDELVAFLQAQRPHAKLILSMDNEPELWSHTHAEIFPTPVTYADLWKRNHDFAKAAKQVAPKVEVLGFVSYGYKGFISLQNASDGNGRNFIEWYLDQARAAEKSEGLRLIDYLDVHWYPEATGGGERIVGTGTGADVVEARVQAARSLWDAKYRETSWVADAAQGPINLIPWLKAKINAHYPGTKLAFTEWNFGGGNHISGALAVADVLGTFGRQGVNLATYWPMGDEPYAYAGFRVFRNYDGQGGSFGDVSIASSSSDPALAMGYGSVDSRDPTRAVIVVINKTTKAKRAGIKLSHSAVYGTADVYVLSGSKPVIGKGAALTAVATNSFNYEMPPLSVSVIVPKQ